MRRLLTETWYELAAIYERGFKKNDPVHIKCVRCVFNASVVMHERNEP